MPGCQHRPRWYLPFAFLRFSFHFTFHANVQRLHCHSSWWLLTPAGRSKMTSTTYLSENRTQVQIRIASPRFAFATIVPTSYGRYTKRTKYKILWRLRSTRFFFSFSFACAQLRDSWRGALSPWLMLALTETPSVVAQRAPRVVSRWRSLFTRHDKSASRLLC